MENKPTNNELKIMLDNLAKNSEEKHQEFSDALKEIKQNTESTLNQTRITNGRTTNLEAITSKLSEIIEKQSNSIENLKNWRSWMFGAGAILMVIGISTGSLYVEAKARTVAKEVLLDYMNK